MPAFRPKYITFDCHGTSIHFRIEEATQDLGGDEPEEARMAEVIRNFSAYRLDEVMEHWQPFATVVHNALERTCSRNGVAFEAEHANAIYDRIPNWGPHPDVPAGLARVAEEFPLVTLTNSMDAQIGSNVAELGAPFHALYTAEQAGAYKPHSRAFEYMLNCGPEDILHCSSSFRYDLMAARDLGITNKVWVNRRHEPADPHLGDVEIAGIDQLPGALGL